MKRGKREALTINVQKIIDFLVTDIFSVTFSSKGLKFLSLKADRGAKNIDLNFLKKEQEQRSMDSMVKKVLEETLNFIETGKHDMSLDLTAFTSFQQSVFDVVSKIEPGEVITYKGIAEILGKPGAAQAVGSAVAKNPVSYFLPTHRVIPQKGIGI
ncbi:MAG: methylated-DNA--[protein]-cysteine S-methyltransferase, partial [Firmicutes bacterium]|nr:methylated-DNA--[protein]-cysteine S-methyltransferase [Bacillota bacterium]